MFQITLIEIAVTDLLTIMPNVSLSDHEKTSGKRNLCLEPIEQVRETELVLYMHMSHPGVIIILDQCMSLGNCPPTLPKP